MDEPRLNDCGRECFVIGGRFIAEDPDCPTHGVDATEWHEFDGNDNCDASCRGWNGEDRRCDCGNRRVYWVEEGGFRYPQTD